MLRQRLLRPSAFAISSSRTSDENTVFGSAPRQLVCSLVLDRQNIPTSAGADGSHKKSGILCGGGVAEWYQADAAP